MPVVFNGCINLSPKHTLNLMKHLVVSRLYRIFLAARIQDCYHKTCQLEHDFFQAFQLEFALSPEHFQVVEVFCLSQNGFETDTARDREKLKFALLAKEIGATHGCPVTFIHRHYQTSYNLTSLFTTPTVTTSTPIPSIKGTSEAIR